MHAEPEAKTLPSLESQAESLARSYQPPPTGRPSLLSDADSLRTLLQQLALGNRRETACALAGIGYSTLNLWIAKAKDSADPDSPERAFLELLKKAEAAAEARIVGNVLKASEKEQFWAAGMTYLERKYPEQWGRRQDSESGPKVVVQIGIQASDVSVSILSPSSSQQLPVISTGQVDQQGLINSDYVNQRPGENP